MKGRNSTLLVYKSRSLAIKQMFYMIIYFRNRHSYDDYYGSMDMGYCIFLLCYFWFLFIFFFWYCCCLPLHRYCFKVIMYYYRTFIVYSSPKLLLLLYAIYMKENEEKKCYIFQQILFMIVNSIWLKCAGIWSIHIP